MLSSLCDKKALSYNTVLGMPPSMTITMSSQFPVDVSCRGTIRSNDILNFMWRHDPQLGNIRKSKMEQVYENVKLFVNKDVKWNTLR